MNNDLKLHPDPDINAEVNGDIRLGEEADRKAGLPPQKFEELDNAWLPTPENINKLPEPLRLYIHDLETNSDPAGNLSQLAFQKDTIGALNNRIKELEGACDIFEEGSEENTKVYEVLLNAGKIPKANPKGPLVGAPLQDIVRELLTHNLSLATENVNAHTILGRFPGSTLELAVEVRMNEFRDMTEKHKKMQDKVKEMEGTVDDLKDAVSLVGENTGLVQKEMNLKLADKEKERKKLERKIELTVKDLAKAVSFQRKVGGRPHGTATAKFILPALKRLGWKPTKEK